MMESTSPVDGDFRLALVQLNGPGHRASRRQLAKFVEPIEHGTILADVELLHEAIVVGQVVRPDGLQEAHVLVRVEFRHLLECGLMGTVHLDSKGGKRKLILKRIGILAGPDFRIGETSKSSKSTYQSIGPKHYQVLTISFPA